VRIWDVTQKRQHRDIMVYKSRGKGGRSKMCALAWGPGEGNKTMIASTAEDGGLVVYAGGGPYTRPQMEVREAHKADTWTGGLVFSSDGRYLASRGQDQTIKCRFSRVLVFFYDSLGCGCLWALWEIG
jgi:WD40 repeat protein